MFSHTIRYALNGGGNSPSADVVLTADSKQSFDIALTSSQADAAVDVTFATARLKSIFILSDQNLTVETNDGTTPDDTISIVANQPFIWNTALPYDNPFSADVTELYLTNGAAAAARVQIEVLYDSTP